MQFAFSFAQSKNTNTLLWRIDSKNNEKSSYLFGTIHLPQKKFVVYSDSVYAAIQNVNAFYNEIDFLKQSFFSDPALIAFFQEKAKFMDSVTKTASWKSFIRRINKEYNADLEEDDLQAFVNFSQNLLADLYKSEQGMKPPDLLLAQHAEALGKKTGGIETYLLQFRMLYDIIGARLNDTTMALTDEGEMLTQMKDFYVSEKLDSITAIVERMNPSYKKIVFDDRNKTMADSIAKYSNNESSFFAIGAGHLGGKNGVIEFLRKKGFMVSPVHSENKISMLVINSMLRIYKAKNNKGEMVKDAPAEGLKIAEISDAPPPPPKEEPPKVKATDIKPPVKTKTKTKEQ